MAVSMLVNTLLFLRPKSVLSVLMSVISGYPVRLLMAV